VVITPDNVADIDPHTQDGRGTRPGTWFALAGLAVATLLPFITKPFNIDDPFYLAVARHITESPLDFYGFKYNWYGTLEQVTYANHAPASAYFMAIVGTLAGWSELAMHTAFLLPAIALLLGTYVAATRLCDQPVLASAIAWFCPALFVSATSVMTDVWMAAFFVWAIALWIRGIDESKLGLLCAAIAVASMAGLMKYFGVTVIGLLALYAIGRRHPLRRWAPLLPIPILVLAAYEALTYAMYGQGLVSSSFQFADEGRGATDIAWYDWIVSGLSFTGGGLAAAAIVMLLAWPRKMWIVWAVLFAALLARFATIESYRGLALRGSEGVDWTAAIHLAIFVTLGAQLLALTAWRLLKDRTLEMLVIAAWIAGVFIFSTYVNWSVTARTFVPMAPAAGILAIRAARFDDGRNGWRYGATLAAAVLALSVAWGDMSWSRSVRDTANFFNDGYRGKPVTVYFQGHWGFQYYADPNVMRSLDVERTELYEGDIVVTLKNNSVASRLPARLRARTEPVLAGEGRWSNTMLGAAGAGFYSDLFGPLPFRIGPGPGELYLVTQVRTPPERSNGDSPDR
jgi:hypothetical protein